MRDISMFEMNWAAILIWHYGMASHPQGTDIITQAGKEALAEGGIEAMSTLLDNCQSYAVDVMGLYRDEWRMIASVWEVTIPEWHNA